MTPYQLACDQAHAYLERPLPHGGLSDDALRWMVRTLLALRPADLDILTLWLQGNEQRIACGEDGLGMLAPVFEAVLGRMTEVKNGTV